MSDDVRKVIDGHQQPEFEQQDIRVKAVITFLVGLGLFLVASYFIVIGFYRYMDHYTKAHEPQQNPLVPPRVETRKPTRKGTDQEIKRVFPEPRLEEDERSQLNGVRIREEIQLHSYGWKDEKAGMVHIPIERAMELLAQRGLPVYSGGEMASKGKSAGAGKAGKP